MDVAVEIIGTESLGVRGLSCFIKTRNHKILIDPGVALGYLRHGLLPHPIQIARGALVRKKIIRAAGEATDIVFSHFHGDHIPFHAANVYQLAIDDLPPHFNNIRCWSKSVDRESEHIKQRAYDLKNLLQNNFHAAENQSYGSMTFSPAVPHGEINSRQGMVMMTRIDLGNAIFVHGSDIQLLDTAAIDIIISWQPDIIFAAGPPLYLNKLSSKLRLIAWRNALRLAEHSNILILDHHLMRNRQGIKWLNALSCKANKPVYCAADFMHQKPLLLEARRTQLYRTLAVPPHWHEQYEKGLIGTNPYLSENICRDRNTPGTGSD